MHNTVNMLTDTTGGILNNYTNKNQDTARYDQYNNTTM